MSDKVIESMSDDVNDDTEWVDVLKQFEIRDCSRCKNTLPDCVFWIKPHNQRKKCRICLDELAEAATEFKLKFPHIYHRRQLAQQRRAAAIRSDPEAKYRCFHLPRIHKEGFKDEFSKEEFIKLFYSAECYYCGYHRPDVVLCGADRLNGDQGYVRANLLPCCKTCNNMKHTLPLSAFIQTNKRIYKKLRTNPYIDFLDIVSIDTNHKPEYSIRGGKRR